ncbi:Fe-S cluster assembly scaffold protein NifU [Pseudoflavonifractor sp. 524-17]|uniref:Fe-S cluster assembly scaffold protein NifU n=1 Tax=Pseudoflavonifractor sp. 524-17 TaxID=2304577 RepID=UPI00137A41AB|nr:Fe-S cluster assembly scaffold protein NifU [Pseudoflavonifractor sp. 524-17]NCE65631.1 Fe-S cluster assembly scaffold protein NifU [Pseudoflavonifractor sp. 524-17]
MYTDKVMDYFQHPRNVGALENPDAVGVAGNPKCGDIMQITLRVEGNIITDVGFKTFGCGAAIATSSMATEMIKGRTVEEAFTLTNEQVAHALGGLPVHKMHCSVLAEQAIKAAIGDYYVRQGILDLSEVKVYDAPEEAVPEE